MSQVLTRCTLRSMDLVWKVRPNSKIALAAVFIPEKDVANERTCEKAEACDERNINIVITTSMLV